MDFRTLDFSARNLHPYGPGGEPIDHFVEFYDDEAALITTVRTFLSIGIAEGDAAIVVADPHHKASLDSAMGNSVDLRAAAERGLHMSLDADEVLDTFMKDGMPDPDSFTRVIGTLVERASRAGRNVRVFGEMVAMLCKRGNVAGAVALEDLWNRLAKDYPFRLFCAYPAGLFGEEDLDAVYQVCDRHSHVLVPAASAI